MRGLHACQDFKLGVGFLDPGLGVRDPVLFAAYGFCDLVLVRDPGGLSFAAHPGRRRAEVRLRRLVDAERLVAFVRHLQIGGKVLVADVGPRFAQVSQFRDGFADVAARLLAEYQVAGLVEPDG